MKATISSTIKAHLFRGAFYLLLLVGVCVIPFALVQRTTAKGNRPATTITVTTTADSGPGSLRQALAVAHDGDRIIFSVSGTITLTSGALVVAKNVTISGPGTDQLSIVGMPFQSVFSVELLRSLA